MIDSHPIRGNTHPVLKKQLNHVRVAAGGCAVQWCAREVLNIQPVHVQLVLEQGGGLCDVVALGRLVQLWTQGILERLLKLLLGRLFIALAL